MPTFRPGKPYILCRAPGGQALTTAGDSDIALNELDSDGDVSLSTPTVIIGLRGLYAIACGLATIRASGAHGHRLVLNVNASAVAGAGNTGQPQAVSNYTSCSKVLQLEDGDTVSLAARSLTNNSDVVAAGSFLDVVRIGPLRWT